jgi:AraC family transcriptional regulator
MSEESTLPSWTASPKWYLWDGGFLLVSGSDGVVPSHAHHAIRVVITTEGEAGISEDGREWRTGRGILVPPDVVHSYAGRGALGAMLFIDPESIEGAWLRGAIGERIAIVPPARVIPVADALRTFRENPFEAMELGQLVRYAVESLCAGRPPARHPDPRIGRVLQRIASSEDLRISVEQAAATAFLSPSRFQHLFKQQVGLAFRRYILWRKVLRAMVAVAQEKTLAAAAHAADFADAAHLTRTFHQMFGLAPSLLMQGDLYVVPSPFVAVEKAA